MRVRLTALALALASLPACVNDEGNESFVATLTGAAERPTPVTTAASGSAILTLTSIGSMNFQVSATGLSGPATMAHIHGPGDANAVVGIIHTFAVLSGTGVVSTGSFGAPSNAGVSMDSLMVLLRAGLAYVNVHTAANVDGEIRGQLSPQ